MVRNWHYRITDFDAMHEVEEAVEVSDSFNIALGSQKEVKSQLESMFTSFQQTKFSLHHLHLVIVAGGTRKIRW